MAINPILFTLATAAFLFLCAPAWSAEDAPSSVVEEAPPPADDAPASAEGGPISAGDALTFPEEGSSSSAPANQPSEGSVSEARALIKDRRFTEALVLLQPFLEGGPIETDVLFLIGLASTRASQQSGLAEEDRETLLDGAIAAYRSILIHEPGLVRVRLELALAFFLKEEDDLAIDHFERVLAGRPPAPIIANVSRFLNIMRARRRWRGYFGFSLAPDTNISAASNAEAIYINVNGRLLEFTTRGASSGIGLVSWGGVEYQFPLAERWRLRTGFDVNHREYKGGQFDQTFTGVYVGPRWLLDRNTEMSLLAAANQRWWGGSPFNYDIGARLEVQHRVFAGLWLNGRATWQDRTYQQQRFLEGSLMVFSLGANYVLFPTVQVNALVGYQQQETKAHHWNSAGYWTRVGTNVMLPWGFTVGTSAEFRWTNYESGWPSHFRDDGSAREDQTRILQATLLNRAITVFGFSPQIAFSNQVRESNARLSDYKRNLVEMRWVRQF